MYDEEQREIQKQITFAETANNFLKEKQEKISNSKQENECLVDQYDFEQIKSYTIQLKKTLSEKQKAKVSITSPSFEITNNSVQTYSCPLTRPDVFGIKLEHNIRFDCDKPTFPKHTITKHFENYHRMLPECALRLKKAVVNGQSPDETKLFSEDEIIRVINNNKNLFLKKMFFCC